MPSACSTVHAMTSNRATPSARTRGSSTEGNIFRCSRAEAGTRYVTPTGYGIPLAGAHFSVPQLTQRPTPSQGSAFAFPPRSIAYQERATGLEPATSSLGRRSKRTTTRLSTNFPLPTCCLPRSALHGGRRPATQAARWQWEIGAQPRSRALRPSSQAGRRRFESGRPLLVSD